MRRKSKQPTKCSPALIAYFVFLVLLAAMAAILYGHGYFLEGQSCSSDGSNRCVYTADGACNCTQTIRVTYQTNTINQTEVTCHDGR